MMTILQHWILRNLKGLGYKHIITIQRTHFWSHTKARRHKENMIKLNRQKLADIVVGYIRTWDFRIFTNTFRGY